MGLERLQEFKDQYGEAAKVEIYTTLDNAWWIHISKDEGHFDGELSYGNYFDDLEEGLNECLDAVERNTTGAVSYM